MTTKTDGRRFPRCEFLGCNRRRTSGHFCHIHKMQRDRQSAWFGKLQQATAWFWEKVDKSGECWLWTGACGGHGYGNLSFLGVSTHPHIVSYILAKGEVPSSSEVMHTCDVRLCVNPDHLIVGTRLDNARDMVAKGRSLFGERHHAHKLSEQDVETILSRLRRGESSPRLALEYGVSDTTVYRIGRGATWRHLTQELPFGGKVEDGLEFSDLSN